MFANRGLAKTAWTLSLEEGNMLPFGYLIRIFIFLQEYNRKNTTHLCSRLKVGKPDGK